MMGKHQEYFTRLSEVSVFCAIFKLIPNSALGIFLLKHVYKLSSGYVHRGDINQPNEYTALRRIRHIYKVQ